MNAAMSIDPRSDVRARLRRAYASDCPKGYDSENVFVRILEGHGDRHGVLGYRESRLVEDAYFMQDVKRLLGQGDMVLLDCYYIVPANGRLWAHKENRCSLVAERVHQDLDTPKWYTADVVRGWAQQKRHHPDQWWVAHLFKSSKQLHEMRHGTKARRGIIPTLDSWLDCIEYRIEENIP